MGARCLFATGRMQRAPARCREAINMIRPLRQQHRRTFAVLAVMLPAALIIGLAARKPVPTADSLSDEVARAPWKFPVKQWSRDDVFLKTNVRVAFLRDPGEHSRFAFALFAPKAFIKPDLLIYWIPGNTGFVDAIPENAIFLGGFNNSVPL